MNKQLQDKLKIYSAITVGALLTANEAHADIVVTTVNFNGTSSDTYGVDLDNDGNIDFTFRGASYYSAYFFLYFDNNNVGYNGVMGSIGSYSYFYPLNVPAGDFIGSAQTFNSSRSYGSLNFAGYYGNFINVADAYIGVRFTDGTDYFYGWIRVDVSADASSWTIIDFAYNDTPNETIAAGQTLSVKENKAKFGVYATENSLEISSDASLMNASVEVVNMLGQTVATATISSNTTSIAKTFGSGIYIVRIVDEKGKAITKKVRI